MAGAAGTAVLVEFGHSHDVCLYSQALILSRAGYAVHLVCSERLGPRLHSIEGLVGRIELLETERGAGSRRRRLRRARDFVHETGADLVVLNSAQTADVRAFVFLGHPGAPRFVGILHRVHKVRGSLTQRLISRKVSGYFVLADHLLEEIRGRTGRPVASFYPIFFADLEDEPEPPELEAEEAVPHKGNDDIWIAVPGSVELKRRDYAALWGGHEAIRSNPGIRFIFLGRSDPGKPDGEAVRRGIATSGAPDRFQLFDRFVEARVFQAWMRRCDFVMPLLHPGRPEFAYYGDRRVSFAFHVAAGWRIPLLADQYFEQFEDYRGNAVFYDAQRLDLAFDGLHERLAAVRTGAFRGSKWTLEEQSGRYLGLIAAAARQG